MTHRINILGRTAVTVALLAMAGTGLLAQTRQYPSRVNDYQVRQLLQRIENRSNLFRTSLGSALDESRLDGTNREDNLNNFVVEFEAATGRLRDRFNDRQAAAADVEEVLTRASYINSFMERRQLSARAERDWSNLRLDLEQLARHYNVSWRWDNVAAFPNNSQGRFPSDSNRGRSPNYDQDRFPNSGRRNNVGSQLTGTYRLDPSRSDNVADAVSRATPSLAYGERDRVRDRIMRRLEAPETIAIDRRGRTVTVASTRAPQLTFDADGRARTEQMPNGRSIQVTASLLGDQLVVNTAGDRGSDYNVTFEAIDNGQRLRVTRRISDDRTTRPIVVQSTYEKTSDVAQLDLYSGSPYDSTAAGRPDASFPSESNASGSFAVPNGTMLTAVLNNDLSTKQVRQGDRFTLTVRGPREFDGAVIEGLISQVDRAGKVSGRSDVTLDFERIRMRNGRSYNFEGFIEQVRTPNGEKVQIDNEGNVREDDSQTGRTVQRAGVGAALGALIGAIAGGGKGAAIGAAVGAGAGAGTVFVQGREDLELMSGTEFAIRASAPRQ